MSNVIAADFGRRQAIGRSDSRSGLGVFVSSAEIWVGQDNAYAAELTDGCITVKLQLPIGSWPKSKDKRHALLGLLVGEANHRLSREYGLSLYNPQLEVKRARKGYKEIVLTYRMVKLSNDVCMKFWRDMKEQSRPVNISRQLIDNVKLAEKTRRSEDFGDRMNRIRRSLDKINKLMQESRRPK